MTEQGIMKLSLYILSKGVASKTCPKQAQKTPENQGFRGQNLGVSKTVFIDEKTIYTFLLQDIYGNNIRHLITRIHSVMYLYSCVLDGFVLSNMPAG